MPEQPRRLPAERWVDRRLASRALRPRFAAAVIAASWVVAVLVFGLTQWIVDKDSFPTIWLAFWWAIQTVTTVGYGDVVPGDAGGKALGSVLMLFGLSFLSVVTATITSVFVARRQAELQETGEDPVMRRLDTIATQLDAVEAELRRVRGGEPRPPGS